MTYQGLPVWAQYTNATHQFVIWTALESEGLDTSLQHYNPLIDEEGQDGMEIRRTGSS
ncbi:hypothetical protein SAMN03159341_11645 [Paenibacillus sp. 1_12]|nr:hypothetical protein SAMN03159341_11645 [Paenibacillus sp. 1_12]